MTAATNLDVSPEPGTSTIRFPCWALWIDQIRASLNDVITGRTVQKLRFPEPIFEANRAFNLDNSGTWTMSNGADLQSSEQQVVRFVASSVLLESKHSNSAWSNLQGMLQVFNVPLDMYLAASNKSTSCRYHMEAYENVETIYSATGNVGGGCAPLASYCAQGEAGALMAIMCIVTNARELSLILEAFDGILSRVSVVQAEKLVMQALQSENKTVHPISHLIRHGLSIPSNIRDKIDDHFSSREKPGSYDQGIAMIDANSCRAVMMGISAGSWKSNPLKPN